MTTAPIVNSPKTTRMRLPVRLFFRALFFGPAIYFAWQSDYVAAGMLVAMGIASFSGYRAGAVYVVGSLAAIATAIWLAPSIGRAQEFRFAQWFGTTGLNNRLLSIGTVGLLITFVVSLLVITVAGLFFANRPRLETVNRWFGFTLGGAQGVFAVWLFLGGLLILEPMQRDRAGTRDPLDFRGQFVSRWILKISDGIHASRLGPTIVAYNPFTRIPQLNKVDEIQRTVQVLSDPEKIDELMRHPSIERLNRRPEIRRAMDRLRDDPQIQEILRSGNKMDRSAAMALMDHPAVLELIDQPGFLEEAFRLIQDATLDQQN